MIENFKYYKPGLAGSWLMVALMLVGSLVAGVSLPSTVHSPGYLLMMILPIAWCLWQGGNEREAGATPLPVNAPHFGKLSTGAFLALSGIALLALSVVIEPTTSFIPMPDLIKNLFEKVFLESKLWDMILATCILAPLMEEFVCRGMMLRGMLCQMSTRKAILWSAFLFAFMHLNPWQAIPAFLCGIFLGWVYVRTHCLWATIFLHFLNNAISTAISRIWTDLPVDASWKDILPPTTYWVLYASCVVVMAVTVYILYEKTLPAQIQRDLQTESLGQ